MSQTEFQVPLDDNENEVVHCKVDTKNKRAVCVKRVKTEYGYTPKGTPKKFDIEDLLNGDNVIHALDARMPETDEDKQITRVAQKYLPSWIKLRKEKG